MESKITNKEVLTKYMEYVLEYGEEPKSVFAFSKSLNISEAEFYQLYTSFNQLAANIYVFFYKETIKLITTQTNYNELDSKNKLLTFYFTFFELLTNNRSYVVKNLQKETYSIKTLQVLLPLKHKFKEFVKSLAINTVDLKQEKLNSLKNKSIEELAWTQFVFTLKFWLDDTSAGFEKTDLFIEKSVNASFDIIDTTPLENIIDFGKFFFKEKIKPQL